MSTSTSTTTPPAQSQPSPPSLGTLMWRKFCGGTVGGVLLVATGHPLDTIKSRIQAGQVPTLASAMHGLLRGGAGEAPTLGARLVALYRGSSTVFALNGFFTATLFSMNQAAVHAVTPPSHPADERLPRWRTALAAQLTAPVHAVLMAPADTVKVRLQTAVKGAFRGPWDCGRHIYRNEGGLRGLMAGYPALAVFRTVGITPYFVVFDEVQHQMVDVAGVCDRGSIAVPLVAGPAAGIAFWLAAYPLDAIKTTAQMSRSPQWDGHRLRPQGRAGHAMSVTEAARYVGTAGHRQPFAWRPFYKGFGVAALRAVPANSCVWLGVSKTEQWFASTGW